MITGLCFGWRNSSSKTSRSGGDRGRTLAKGTAAENHLCNAFRSISTGSYNGFQRRTALLDFARASDAFVLEDDYNSEFRFNGPPLPCLQGLDISGRVIYAGTMSKILYPSLRLGYLVVPAQLVDPIAEIRSAMDQHSSAIDQATLARFITEAGLQLVAWLRHEANFARVARARAETGVKPPSLAFFCIRAKLKPAFVFSFAAWTPAQIRESLLRLASALR